MPTEEGREVLRLLAEKKIDAEQAYRLLLALGDVPKEGETPGAEEWARDAGRERRHERHHDVSGRGGPRVLRIKISENGQQRVNMAIPLSLARIGKVAGLSRSVARFGIDLRDIAREVQNVGKIVDIADESGDRVEIYVE
jgi:hypothetical protein